jgi:hypothetical protein
MSIPIGTKVKIKSKEQLRLIKDESDLNIPDSFLHHANKEAFISEEKYSDNYDLITVDEYGNPEDCWGMWFVGWFDPIPNITKLGNLIVDDL